MKSIYVDVLVVLNWYIDYFVLLATAKLTHTNVRRKRLVLSGLVGAVSSLIILLPPMHYLVNVLVKFVLSVGLVLIAFGKSSLKVTLKLSLYFCVISFTFAGMVVALNGILHSDVLSTNNSYVYADFSLTFLVVSTALCYGVLCVVRRLVDTHTGATGEWSLSITYHGKSVTIQGLADTGNSLTDSFSGRPVVVCSKDSLRGIINPDEPTSLNGFRLIPFATIGNGGLVVSFIPDSVTITDITQNYSKPIDVLIGISGTCDRAIFNPKVLV